MNNNDKNENKEKNDKQKERQAKKILFAFIWFALGISFVVLLSTAVNKQSRQTINSVSIDIDTESGNHFITEKKITTLLQKYYDTDSLVMAIGDLNLYELEWVLEEHPYIEKANMHVDTDGQLFVKIWQKYPILRVIGDDGQNYYISNRGDKMPTSKDFTARVPIVTGNIKDNNQDKGEIESAIGKDLFELASYIQANPVLNALIEQVVVKNPNQIELVTKIGNHSVILGNVRNLERKFTNLLILYKKQLSVQGWNLCQVVDLSIENQIVCTAN